MCIHRNIELVGRGLGSRTVLPGLIVLCACGPSTLILPPQHPEECDATYRLTVTLSGNQLDVALAEDLPGNGEDRMAATLTYKGTKAPAVFELAPDPTGAGDVEDRPPAMLARVGERVCFDPMDASDNATDACLKTWLSREHCYVLQPE